MSWPRQFMYARKPDKQNPGKSEDLQFPELQGNEEEDLAKLLLWYRNFVAKSQKSKAEPLPATCEAGALTTELTAPNRIYFTPKNQLCKMGAPASSNSYTDTGSLLHGYQLCAATEGKSPKAIAIVTRCWS